MQVPKNIYEQAEISLTPIKTDMTLEEFLESDLEGYEYVKGEIIPMPAASWEHGLICSRVFSRLVLYVQEHQLGEVVTPDTGFQVGERVLKPDVAFLSKDRLPDDHSRACPVSPDLAVEVISHTDVTRRTIEKAFAYLEAGTQIVWILEPIGKTVTVYRSETDIELLTRTDTLTGEDVVEGFSCPVAQLFE
ncbi:MAG: Uma2 family endonuclease [Candidatus Poribacteria bacterium]|nr:Uma2 family endonuclease [Candidatus Poribacteria bacterium]